MRNIKIPRNFLCLSYPKILKHKKKRFRNTNQITDILNANIKNKSQRGRAIGTLYIKRWEVSGGRELGQCDTNSGLKEGIN